MPDYRSFLDGNIGDIRVGVLTHQLESDVVEPDVKHVFLKATSVLADLGASVEEISLPMAKHAGTISIVLLALEPGSNHHRWIRDRLQDYGHDNRIGLLTGGIIPAQAYYKAQKLRSLLWQQVHQALEEYDVLITPTMGTTAQRLVDETVITSKEMAGRQSYLMRRLFSLAGAPAISIPCGLSAQGLPIGLQIGGRPFAEETVLKVAHAYEQSTPWHTMRPPHA